jgi:predicted nucleic acid-binding protein
LRPGAGLLYLDSSALVKLVLPEDETVALREALFDWPERVSSELAGVEVLRAAQRASDDAEVHRRAEAVLDGLHLLSVESSILREAARLAPTALRSLDAIHLASALSLEEDLGGLSVYDPSLRKAALDLGLRIVAPGGAS